MIHCQSCKIPKHVQVQIWTVNFLFMNSVFLGLKSAISAIFLTSTTCRNSKTQLALANHIYFFLGFWYTLKKFSLQSLCLSQWNVISQDTYFSDICHVEGKLYASIVFCEKNKHTLLEFILLRHVFSSYLCFPYHHLWSVVLLALSYSLLSLLKSLS